jgi:hypothetical protein
MPLSLQEVKKLILNGLGQRPLIKPLSFIGDLIIKYDFSDTYEGFINFYKFFKELQEDNDATKYVFLDVFTLFLSVKMFFKDIQSSIKLLSVKLEKNLEKSVPKQRNAFIIVIERFNKITRWCEEILFLFNRFPYYNSYTNYSNELLKQSIIEKQLENCFWVVHHLRDEFPKLYKNMCDSISDLKNWEGIIFNDETPTLLIHPSMADPSDLLHLKVTTTTNWADVSRFKYTTPSLEHSLKCFSVEYTGKLFPRFVKKTYVHVKPIFRPSYTQTIKPKLLMDKDFDRVPNIFNKKEKRDKKSFNKMKTSNKRGKEKRKSQKKRQLRSRFRNIDYDTFSDVSYNDYDYNYDYDYDYYDDYGYDDDYCYDSDYDYDNYDDDYYYCD